MMILAIGIKDPLDLAIQRPHDADAAGPPFSATRINASIAACHSGASCSAFGSLVM